MNPEPPDALLREPNLRLEVFYALLPGYATGRAAAEELDRDYPNLLVETWSVHPCENPELLRERNILHYSTVCLFRGDQMIARSCDVLWTRSRLEQWMKESLAQPADAIPQ